MTNKYEIMKKAGAILREAFSLIFYDLRAGSDLEKIDQDVGKFLLGKRALSALKLVGFPYNMSASLDYEVVQGYPNRILTDSHLVSIDMSIFYSGFYVDKAMTLATPVS